MYGAGMWTQRYGAGMWTQQYQIRVIVDQCVIVILHLKFKVFNTENCLLLKTVCLFWSLDMNWGVTSWYLWEFERHVTLQREIRLRSHRIYDKVRTPCASVFMDLCILNLYYNRCISWWQISMTNSNLYLKQVKCKWSFIQSSAYCYDSILRINS